MAGRCLCMPTFFFGGGARIKAFFPMIYGVIKKKVLSNGCGCFQLPLKKISIHSDCLVAKMCLNLRM